MAKPSFIYCPQCRRVGIQDVELMTEAPEQHIFRCMNGHAFEYKALMDLQPDLKKLVVHEKPGDHDVKAEFWIHKDVLTKFREKFPNQMSATVNSILQMFLTGDVLIVDGSQAKKLNDLGVKTGQDIVAALEASKSTEDQLSTVTGHLNLLKSIMGEKAELV